MMSLSRIIQSVEDFFWRIVLTPEGNMQRLRNKIKELEKENAELDLHIGEINDKIDETIKNGEWFIDEEKLEILLCDAKKNLVSIKYSKYPEGLFITIQEFISMVDHPKEKEK